MTSLRTDELQVGLSYRIQNGRDFDMVLECVVAAGDSVSKDPLFQCKYGCTWHLGINFYKCYTITGPVEKDVITEADLQRQREEDEKYRAYVRGLEPWER